MKSYYKHILPLIALGATFTFNSCSDNDDPDPTPKEYLLTATFSSPAVQYGNDGLWVGWNQDDDLYDGLFEFSHDYTLMSGGFPYVTGFVAARIANNDYIEPMSQHSYTVMPKGGVKGVGTPYVVAFWDEFGEQMDSDVDDKSCSIAVEINDYTTFRPIYTYVTNTCYAYYTMLNGNNFAKKFAQGDYFKVIAHGVVPGGAEKTTEFMLADCSGTNQSNWIVDKWQKWDLTSLGEVAMVYFTMESSDKGAYGMNTPAYFALSDFTAVVYDYQ